MPPSGAARREPGRRRAPPAAGVDLAVGLVLIAIGGLLAAGWRPGRRRVTVPGGDDHRPKKDGWALRVLR